MPVYRKFSDTLRDEVWESAAPKPPKLPKDGGFEAEAERTLDALDALGGLDGGELENRDTPGAETTTQPSITEHPRIDDGDFADGAHGHLNHLKQQSSSGGIKEEGAAAVERDRGAIRRNAVSAMESELVAPASWFERSSSLASGEPAFDKPYIPRRGRVERQGGLFLHFCVACGAWGAFGYGVTGDRPGRWYCREHRPRDEIS